MRRKFPQNNQAGHDFLHILFLSKRGTSRAVLASDILSKILSDTSTIRFKVSFRGVTKVYDQCPVDNRINVFSYPSFNPRRISRFADAGDLEISDLVITLDQESRDFTKLHRLGGKVYPISLFLPPDYPEFIGDPYDRGESNSAEERHREIIEAIQCGCEGIKSFLDSSVMA